jgi:ankyrin repeat protein
MKRIAQEEEDVALFIKTCKSGTFKDMCEFMSLVQNPNFVHGKKMRTPLIYACSNPNWVEAEQMVVLLLSMGALHNVQVKHGSTALHYAAQSSSVNIVSILLKEGHFVDVKNHKGLTALFFASERRDAEGTKIAKVLLENNASLDVKLQGGTDPLGVACERASLEMVQLFLPAKHPRVNAANIEGYTPLMHACRNAHDGQRIIPYLIGMGADITLKHKGNGDALQLACAKNAALVKAILPFLPNRGEAASKGFVFLYTQAFKRPNKYYPDHLGVLRELGIAIPSHSLVACIRFNVSLDFVWATTRMTPPLLDGSQNDWYTVLRELAPNNTKLWNLVTAATSGGRHPVTGDTTLHAGVRTGNPNTVGTILSRLPNPFFRNVAGETPLDLAFSLPKSEHKTQIIACLRYYSQWKPSHIHTDWYGPFFRTRAKTFLLVNQRLKLFPKDLVWIIIRCVANLEYV